MYLQNWKHGSNFHSRSSIQSKLCLTTFLRKRTRTKSLAT
jgi:hypothetical protein